MAFLVRDSETVYFERTHPAVVLCKYPCSCEQGFLVEMKAGDKLMRLVQLTVLLAVPLDAFAMSPGRLNSVALHNKAILRGRAKATLPLRAAEALPSALGAPEATNTVQTVTGGAGGEQVGYGTLFGRTL